MSLSRLGRAQGTRVLGSSCGYDCAYIKYALSGCSAFKSVNEPEILHAETVSEGAMTSSSSVRNKREFPPI
jgi:hypothetical protein